MQQCLHDLQLNMSGVFFETWTNDSKVARAVVIATNLLFDISGKSHACLLSALYSACMRL